MLQTIQTKKAYLGKAITILMNTVKQNISTISRNWQKNICTRIWLYNLPNVVSQYLLFWFKAL